MKKKIMTPKIDWSSECKLFTRYMSLLLLVVLLFVGLICVPSMMEKVSLKKQQARVSKVHYRSPSVSIVDLQVGKMTVEKKSISHSLQEKDVILVYVSNNKHVYLEKPKISCLMMLILYFFFVGWVVGLNLYTWWS